MSGEELMEFVKVVFCLAWIFMMVDALRRL